MTVKQPELWDVDTPYLYTLVTKVMRNEECMDRYTTPVGIRTFSFDARKGFTLNGRQTKINGVCMHHDLGCLGAAVNTRAIERQLQILKKWDAMAYVVPIILPHPNCLISVIVWDLS